MSLTVHEITVGDTRTPIGATLKQSGTALDVTSLTVQFRMIDSNGDDVVAWTASNVTKSSPTAGQVQYDFQSADVDTAGTYYAFFRAGDGSEWDTFPVGKELVVLIRAVDDAELSEIVPLKTLLDYLGKFSSVGEEDLAAILSVRSGAEAAVRRYVDTDITQHTYTHFLPVGHPLRLRSHQPYLGQYLYLPRWPVRSITSVYEDQNAYFGQASNSFAASSELTAGSDYHQILDQASFNKQGVLVRIGREWYAQPGSYKVTYQAGYTAAELAGEVTDPQLDASHIQLATLEVIAEHFVQATGRASGQSGPIKSERLGDYAVTYATTGEFSIPDTAKQKLRKLKRRIPILQ